MAWIVKDSAHAPVERRPQPYLSDEMKKAFEADIVSRYAVRQAALLPVCHEIQHRYGYLPAQALEETAEFLGLSYAQVIDTVTFYEEFHLKPKGRHLVQVCRSISCELCGCRDLSGKLQKKLGVLSGETTDDGRITFMELECLGSCDTAPVAMVDEHLHEKLGWETLEALIDKLD